MPLPAFLLPLIGGAGGLLGSLIGGKKGNAISAGGNLLSTIGNIAGPAGATATGAAGGMADERTRENMFASNANNNRTSRYGIQQGAATNLLSLAEQGALDRAKLGLQAPSARANQILKGSLMANVQDATMSHPRAHIPNIQGGMRPSALSPTAREAGNLLQSQGMAALQSGSDVPEATDFKSGLLPMPEMDEYKEPGGAESALGIGGNIGSLIGPILQALAKQGVGQQKQLPAPGSPGFEDF